MPPNWLVAILAILVLVGPLVTVGRVVSALTDLGYLAVMRKLEPHAMREGYRGFGDRVILPYFGILVGAAIGTDSSQDGRFDWAVVIARGLLLIIGFVVPVQIWRNDRKALAERWYRLSTQHPDKDELNHFHQDLETQAAKIAKSYKSKSADVIITLLCLLSAALFGRAVLFQEPQGTYVIGLATCLACVVINVFMFVVGDRLVRDAKVGRLNRYWPLVAAQLAELDGTERQKSQDSALERRAEKARLARLARSRPHHVSRPTKRKASI